MAWEVGRLGGGETEQIRSSCPEALAQSSRRGSPRRAPPAPFPGWRLGCPGSKAGPSPQSRGHACCRASVGPPEDGTKPSQLEKGCPPALTLCPSLPAASSRTPTGTAAATVTRASARWGWPWGWPWAWRSCCSSSWSWLPSSAGATAAHGKTTGTLVGHPGLSCLAGSL